MDRFEKNTTRHERYRNDILIGVTVSLALVVACIRWWPMPKGDGEDLNIYDIRGQETIELEEIQQTTQEEKKPPPPAPIPPVVVPDDVVLEEIPLDITDSALAIDDPGDDEELVEAAETGSQAQRADRGPVAVMISEPEYPRDAGRARVRAAVKVRVRVDRRGYVEAAEIVGRYLIDKKDESQEEVDTIGYGVEESALKTARKWRFRPAIEEGQLVASYTTITLTFGI